MNSDSSVGTVTFPGAGCLKNHVRLLVVAENLYRISRTGLRPTQPLIHNMTSKQPVRVADDSTAEVNFTAVTNLYGT